MDRFGERVTYYVKGGDGPFALAKVFTDRMLRGLRDLPGTTKVTARASAGGSSVSRETLVAASDALSEHDLVPTSFHVTLSHLNPENKNPYIPTAEVSIFTGPASAGLVGRGFLMVDVKASSRVVADGLLARFSSGLEALKADGTTVQTASEAARSAALEDAVKRHSATSSPENDSAAALALKKTIDAGIVSATAEPRESGWWKRTWRDHAAQAVGALIVGLIVLGLTIWLLPSN